MSHSPEPWRGDEPIRSGTDFWDSCPVIRDSEGVAIAAVMDLANLRRIVACVNACAGFHTEELEKFTRAGATFKMLLPERPLFDIQETP